MRLQSYARLVTLRYMSVTGISATEREHYLAAVNSLVKSQVLHGLRVKLSEYYASEGADDPLIVELPRGSYSLVFQARPILPRSQSSETETRGRVRERHILRTWSAAVIILSSLLAAGVAALVGTWESRSRNRVGSVSLPAPAAFRTFWKGFLSGPDEPWVIFSNAAFVGRPETGMRYRQSQDSDGLILDHYTGVGEVLAVHDLDRVFHLLNRELRVKRGSLFSLDDAKKNNLIFVGSPAENLTLRDLPVNHQFVFRRVESGARKGELAVFNVHPQGTEPTFFASSPRNTPLSEDYSVIALVPGLDPSQSAMDIGGYYHHRDASRGGIRLPRRFGAAVALTLEGTRWR